MNLITSAAAGAAAFALLAGAALGGWVLRGSPEPARVPAPTVTVTRAAPAITVTASPRAKPAPTVTRTVTMPPSVPCQDIGGSPEPGVITPGLPGDTTCTVTLVSPMGADHLAQITLTAPGGDASTWNLANPNG